MTELLFHTDSYLNEFAATVTDVTDSGVVLGRTAFYIGGGGQPGDIGTLECQGQSYPVSRVGRADGQVVHQIEGEKPPVGGQVTGRIDWERRYLLMRTHTALHIFCGVVWRDYGARVTGGDMQPGSARMDFELEQMSAGFAEPDTSFEDTARGYLVQAVHHLIEEEYQEALDALEQAQGRPWPGGKSIIQMFQGYALTRLQQYDAAFSALESSNAAFKAVNDSLPGGPDLEQHILQHQEHFYRIWALPGLLQCAQGFVDAGFEDMIEGGHKVVAVLRKARAKGQEAAVWSALDAVEKELLPEIQARVQDLRDFIELIAIENPFRRSEVLAKRIAASWPEGLDCAEAVREQRR